MGYELSAFGLQFRGRRNKQLGLIGAFRDETPQLRPSSPSALEAILSILLIPSKGFSPLRTSAPSAVKSRRLNRHRQSPAGELLLVQLRPFAVRRQEQRDAPGVGFEHALHGFLFVQGREDEDGLDHEIPWAHVVVVKQDLPGRQLLGLGLGGAGPGAGRRLRSRLGGGRRHLGRFTGLAGHG